MKKPHEPTLMKFLAYIWDKLPTIIHSLNYEHDGITSDDRDCLKHIIKAAIVLVVDIRLMPINNE